MAIFRPETPAGQKSDRSAGDRLRHRQKVRESIRENIADIISEESIIGKSRDRIIKVPIRGIREYRFIYGVNEPKVGQGEGKGTTVPGQAVGKVLKSGEKGEDRAGDRPGEDYYETDVTLDELIEIMFEDLELPLMERKALKVVPTMRTRRHKGYRAKGIRARLDKRETARARVKRKKATDSIYAREREVQKKFAEAIATGDDKKIEEAHRAVDALRGQYQRHSDLQTGKTRFPFHEDDLTYRHVVTDIKEESNAVVFCLMDTSGSMDTMKKYLARSFFFLLSQFISTKYRQVEIVFIAHHTEAREVTEEEFFHKRESGGTFISSAYTKMLEVVAKRYHPSLWNIYAFHCSDGDNFASDNTAALKAAAEICKVANLFGYGEIKPLGARQYEFSMLNVFKKLTAENFIAVLIEKKEDVWPVFKQFLGKEVE